MQSHLFTVIYESHGKLVAQLCVSDFLELSFFEEYSARARIRITLSGQAAIHSHKEKAINNALTHIYLLRRAVP